jgi:gliding motility-associated-like protein
VVQPVRDFFIKNVSVSSAGEVEVTWGWNASAEVKEVDVLRSNQNSGYNSVFSESPTLPLLSEKTYNDNTADPSAGKVFYKIQTVDNCDSVAFSTYGATVHLTGEAQPGNINLLTWTDLDIENAVSTSFDLYRIFNGAETLIATLPGPSSSHSDPFDPGSQGGTGACYYVIATGDLTTPTGETVTIRSRSNTVCLEQPLQVFVPNAFAPEGFNQEFMPVISPPDIARYEMRIFNRYGQELFQSNSPTSGWNGKKGTQKMPQGVYVYQILVTQPSGKVTEKRGSVLLLR